MSAASAALASLVLGLFEHKRSGWTPLGWPEPAVQAAEDPAEEAQAGHECPACECVCEEPVLPAHRAWLRQTASAPGYTLEGSAAGLVAGWFLSRLATCCAHRRVNRRPRGRYEAQRVPGARARPALSL